MATPTTCVEKGSGPLVTPLPFTHSEYERRLGNVRAAMKDRGLAAFISFTPENLYYLTAHDTPGYYFYQACVVTLDQPPVNVLRSIEASNTLGRGWARRAVAYADRADPVKATLGLLNELGVANKTVGAEGDAWFVSPNRYARLAQAVRKSGGSFVDASGLVESFRMIKSPEEIVYIRAAARALERAMAAAIAASREGTNENEVAAAMYAELIRAGGEYAGLPPFISSGPRTSLIHSTWAGRTYQKGDVLNYELPGVVNRYCAALMRCGVVGEPWPELSLHARMLIECLETIIPAIKPGVTSDQIHQMLKKTFAKYGYAHLVGRRTAYSVGINYPPDWGEGHIISLWEGDQRPVQPGMTFHHVPSFSELGKYNLGITETILVTETGCESITKFPRELFTA